MIPAGKIAALRTGEMVGMIAQGEENDTDEYLSLIHIQMCIRDRSFIAQYKAIYRNSENLNTVTNIHIQPEHMQPIEFDKMVFSNLELGKFAMDIIRKKSEEHPIRQKKNLQLSMQINNCLLYTSRCV